MVIDIVAVATANMMVALVGLAAFIAREDAKYRAPTGRASSSRRRRLRVVWVINEIGRPSSLATGRRGGPST